ncbi:sensor histidine kinase [Pedobacter punctiformis]|uniref:histidine kinase n=1 Tax=Pedobacter punctiformis TaxID=3004097 RepID=A0ABT4L898_9SPHI|nr:ATP-binding protein [Pedobacter sp. HCMS5-2]MCZ4244155.1 histidine kinase [Pedobacter sp. HCMS5-2]
MSICIIILSTIIKTSESILLLNPCRTIKESLLPQLNCFTPISDRLSILFLSIGLLEKWWPEILIFTGFILLLAYVVYRNYAFSKSKYFEQQKFIKLERQRISGEIHDEIGAGISAIKLYAELATKKREDVDEIKQINIMINELALKINEIVWSTNAESDDLESLLYYIEEQTRNLFKHSEIIFEASIPQNIPNLAMDSQSRRNCYLLVKEVAHNTIKHSKAKKVKLEIVIQNGIIIFSIKDDGIGFDPNLTKINSMGLTNVKQRIEKLKGELVIENYKGTEILIRIPLEGNVAPNSKPIFE